MSEISCHKILSLEKVQLGELWKKMHGGTSKIVQLKQKNGRIGYKYGYP